MHLRTNDVASLFDGKEGAAVVKRLYRFRSQTLSPQSLDSRYAEALVCSDLWPISVCAVV